MKVATVFDGALTIPAGTLLALRAEVLAALLAVGVHERRCVFLGKQA